MLTSLRRPTCGRIIPRGVSPRTTAESPSPDPPSAAKVKKSAKIRAGLRDEMLPADSVSHEAFPRYGCMRSYRNAAPACSVLGRGSHSCRRTGAGHRPLTKRKDHLSRALDVTSSRLRNRAANTPPKSANQREPNLSAENMTLTGLVMMIGQEDERGSIVPARVPGRGREGEGCAFRARHGKVPRSC